MRGRGLKVVGPSLIDRAKVSRDGPEFASGGHELTLLIPQLDTAMSLFGSKEANSFIQGGRGGHGLGLMQNSIYALLFPLPASLSKFLLKIANRLAEVESLGSLSKRSGWLLLEKAFKVPEAFDARLRE